MAAHLPEGWHTVTPRLIAEDPATLVDFLKRAFDASGELTPNAPAVMRIGDSIVMVSGAGPREASASLIHLYVDNADATFQKALQAGAICLEEPADMPYGDRRAMVRDPSGNDWQIATYRPPVAP